MQTKLELEAEAQRLAKDAEAAKAEGKMEAYVINALGSLTLMVEYLGRRLTELEGKEPVQ